MQSHSGHTNVATQVAAMIGRSLRQGLLLGAMAVTAGAFASGAHATELALYPFCSLPSCADGQDPAATLLNIGGTLFGTTEAGGALTNRAGTVFSLVPCSIPPCTETVLHSFGGTGDGAIPYGGLIRIGAWMYGTTLQGGTTGYGTAFKMKSNGTGYAVLHSFGSGLDGKFVFDSLTPIKDIMYGTTWEGGAGSASCTTPGCGTVFALSTTGAETPLYSFCSLPGCADGSYPAGRMLFVPTTGYLYGTTESGGANGDGEVFQIRPNGSGFAVLYSFGATPTDGQQPRAGLVYKTIGGTTYLYGTTSIGGASNDGTVFAVTTAGVETWLYSFAGLPLDGAKPYGDLVVQGPWLWGTTSAGGGQGTVFKLKWNGLTGETVQYPFTGTTDGGLPFAGLIKVGTELYGTTNQGGGTGNCGACGTVFEVN